MIFLSTITDGDYYEWDTRSMDDEVIHGWVACIHE